MSLVRCPNGHLFSARRYGNTCPYCHMETNRRDEKELSEAPEDFDISMELLEEEIEPVCGWLVCVTGVKQGKSYGLRSGKNFVGRSDEMDVQILGDNLISRKNHTIIVYDEKKKSFVILPGDSAGIVYLNGEAVYTPADIKAYDAVEMGASKFLFVPFCGEFFGWDDVMKGRPV